MLRFVHGHDLPMFPRLADSMFRDRADQFAHRLRWPVTVDARGWEQDGYDGLDPLYVIWERPDGTHGGSMRFLPTTGRTMVADHFAHLIPGVDLASPAIWECTRFCLAPGSEPRIAAALMAGGGELMRAFLVDHFVGVFDARMVRIYRVIGASPDVLGAAGEGRDRISVGLWHYDPDDRVRVLARAGLSATLVEHWFARAFGPTMAPFAISA